MAIRVALNHKTSYKYDRKVNVLPQVIRLRPAPHCRTPVTSYSLKVAPQPHFVNWQQDPHGNHLARFVFPEQADSLEIEVDLVAELTVINPFDFFLETYAETYPFKYEAWLAEELKPYLVTEPAGTQMQAWLASVDYTPRRTIDVLVQLNAHLQQEIEYGIRLEPGVKTPEQTLGDRSGSCRDSAWLLVQILRNLGLAARFVSGYLIQLTPDIKPLDGPGGTDRDFTDLHAWTEVYLPGAGWIGLDPTSGLFTSEGHLPLACTPEPSSAAPITGAVDPCESEFNFAMTITRIHEDPRVTKPYTDKQWREIEALGHRVDAELEAGAVRLTMGGEPTFVSIDDMDGDEWNTAAMGPRKRVLAGDLMLRLRKRFGAGGLYHAGQGKWYPGEPLPRWALSCFWRRDGLPIWHDDSLLADLRNDLNHETTDANAFISTLAERLAVDVEHVQPAYEDVWHYMLKERRLPVNVDPLDSRLENAQDRARLAKIFERGLGKAVGYVLPLERRAAETGTAWASGKWTFRDEHMYLIPGDSPIGYRLPLDSLPWVAKTDYPYVNPLDPMAERSPLPDFSTNGSYTARVPGNGHAHAGNGSVEHGEPGHGFGGSGSSPTLVTQASHTQSRAGTATLERSMRATGAPALALAHGQSAKQVVRTAICVEPRQGRLHVFMPPVERLEDYLELITAIEKTAAELALPVTIEGYLPPHDHRINHIKVTPDPGVIEVNIHPAHSWDELVKNTTGLYEDARESRLGTEKFMLDGRHTGTGGGNHIVIGGPTPAESPLLRRPDLLRSLVAYWNNHPALSYLFSGLFIGPTSQAPRVDEARHDSIYELGLAFEQLPKSEKCPPWLVDRAFRHLLTDLTGNTHRAEFCIDKLYSPDSSSGRLGLLEFRAFEMPPHARMSLTQQLLLRSLIARFWKQPFEERLVRWGTGLHDRFLLPHFVSQDFADVLDDLGDAGFHFEHDWFASHFEFRFPLLGRIQQRGIELELRQAIEPWNVLGEEPGGGGTVRFVDSSLERLQVKATGLTDGRHVVACNGRRVPLAPTGTVGEAVAGVRYRAWQPPNCLHPTIGIDTPLVFDLIDTWNNRSIGGCVWHVTHPGGLSYEKFPVNAYEAESRRGNRFFKIGHTPGKTDVPPEEQNPDFPLTLDMRFAERVAGLG